MKNTLLFLFISFSLFLLSACTSFFNNEIIIDNDDFSTMHLTVDGKTQELAGYTTLTLKLPKGEHEFTAVIEGEAIFDSTITIKENGLVNLMKNTYVVWHDLYLKNPDEYEKYATEALKNEDVKIANKLYEDVQFEVYEGDVFIPKNWDFGLDEEWPEEVDFSGEYAVKGKIYRLIDLEESWGFYQDFDFSDKTDEELNQFLDSLINDVANDSTAVQ